MPRLFILGFILVLGDVFLFIQFSLVLGAFGFIATASLLIEIFSRRNHDRPLVIAASGEKSVVKDLLDVPVEIMEQNFFVKLTVTTKGKDAVLLSDQFPEEYWQAILKSSLRDWSDSNRSKTETAITKAISDRVDEFNSTVKGKDQNSKLSVAVQSIKTIAEILPNLYPA